MGVLHTQQGSAALVAPVRALTARADLLGLRLAKWSDGWAEARVAARTQKGRRGCLFTRPPPDGLGVTFVIPSSWQEDH